MKKDDDDDEVLTRVVRRGNPHSSRTASRIEDAPIAVDLCCGRGGWVAGLVQEGWRVVAFDLARPASFPDGALFVQQDVSTLSGLSWRGRVRLVVASPPCTEFSQCWQFARHRAPDPAGGMVLVRHCFRIAQEAGAPFVLENVMGARKWFAAEFGPPVWHVGPYWFWGDPLVLRPYGLFRKGIWNTGRDKTGARRWVRDNRAATYVRDKAERARIPIEIARAVGSQFKPLTADAVREDGDQPVVTIRDKNSSSSSSCADRKP